MDSLLGRYCTEAAKLHTSEQEVHNYERHQPRCKTRSPGLVIPFPAACGRYVSDLSACCSHSATALICAEPGTAVHAA
jgi:hypothetical protein